MTAQLEPETPQLINFLRKYLSFAVGWVQVVCLTYALLTIRADTSWWPHFFSTWTIAQIATFICFWGQYSCIYLFAAIKKQKPVFKSWSYAARNSIIFLPLGVYLGVKIRNLIWQAFEMKTTPWSWEYLYVGLILGSICISIFFFLSRYVEKNEKAKKLEIDNLNNKLTTLSLQMNPHFLFNILNNLAESIHTQPDIAEKITLTLADLLRKILAATKKDKHSLRNELSLCHSYIDLEKLRYKIDIIESISSGLLSEATQVPVMVIQPLLENAIRHGRKAKINLEIFRKDKSLIIQVSNRFDKSEKKTMRGTQTALENIKSRLELIYPHKSATLVLEPKEPDLMVATLVLPIGLF